MCWIVRRQPKSVDQVGCKLQPQESYYYGWRDEEQINSVINSSHMILGDVNFPKLFVLIFWRPFKPFKCPPSRVKKDHVDFKYNVAPKEVTSVAKGLSLYLLVLVVKCLFTPFFTSLILPKPVSTNVNKCLVHSWNMC